MNSASRKAHERTRPSVPIIGFALVTVAALFVWGCGNDEDGVNSSPSARPVIGLTYENPLVIAVDELHKRALLLHNREASSGPALQFVDLDGRRVLSTRILIDYYDVYDVLILSSAKGCLAGRPHGNRGYAVQFFSLPDLVLGTQIMTADTSGTHGYLTTDSADQMIYYSHAGGGEKDGVFKVSISSETMIDADDDHQPPYSLDNDLVNGLFARPAALRFDAASRKLVVANSGDNFLSLIDASLWGSLHRTTDYSFPIPGTSHLSTLAGGLSTVTPLAVGFGAGVHVFAGESGGRPFLARFTVQSNGLDLLVTPPVSGWLLRNHLLPVDARPDIVSLFIGQRDTDQIQIGQYRLNNLASVAGSPYTAHVIPDSAVGAIAVISSLDQLIVADVALPRLELIEIE